MTTTRRSDFRSIPPDGPGDPGGQVERVPTQPAARRLPPDGPGDPGGVVYEPASKHTRLVRIPGDGPGDPGSWATVEDKPKHKTWERPSYDF